jgi:adenylate cyclase class IV
MNKLKQTAIFASFSLLFQNALGQTQVPKSTIKEIEAAETKMFESISKIDRKEYLKNYVTDDYFSINADGSTQTREQVAADTISPKLFSAVTYKTFDKKIKVYDKVGIVTGRVQAFMKDTMVVEFLYTAVFLKQKEKWMFANWQGTISKDSPPPPPMPKG